MQVSGVSLTLTWPLRLYLLRVLLCAMPLLQAFPFPSTLGRWYCTCFLRPACLFTVHMGSESSPILWSFPLTATSTSFPSPSCWVCAAAPAFSSRLVVRDFPSPHLWCSGHPALFAMCVFCCYCLLFSFFSSFFPGWGSVGSGGSHSSFFNHLSCHSILPFLFSASYLLFASIIKRLISWIFSSF
jgi:hypothetical protein